MPSPLDGELEAVLASSPGAPEAPSLADVEALLTRGYAEALELEVERLRVVQEIESLLSDPGAPQVPREIAELRSKLAALANRLRSLRERLAETGRVYGIARPFSARPG